ncbi:MAG TPA: helix-turn-helix domain-containing protein [Gemmatimonadaceae bacterium]|jgi:AraC-like DNA-binding protein
MAPEDLEANRTSINRRPRIPTRKRAGYLTQIRVEHAARLIKASVHIGSVPPRVGFTDQSHLNRHFKRWMGVTLGVFARGGVAGRAA